jgi:APA family basic amino acid/polyamine antiporter
VSTRSENDLSASRPTLVTSRPAPGKTGLVASMGLFSATSIVVGAMIGSGIFIVPADIGRDVGSPALLIGAWVVTAVMTMIGALSYGELAAMMPKAGGQYIYLREALGRIWGFLFGWTLFLVIQTGTIAAVAVAFGKFLGVFFPSVSSTHWIWHIAHAPAWHVGPMVLGNMDIGLSTANLAGIVIILLLAFVNIFGVKLGALVQNVFTTAKTAALLGLVILGVLFGRNAVAMRANFGRNFWHGAGWHTLHAVQVGMGGTAAMVGVLTILAVVQTGSLFSADAWNNVTYTAGEVRNPKRNLPLSLALGTTLVLGLYILANFVYLMALPLHGDPNGATIVSRGIQYATDDRVATAALQLIFSRAGAYLMAGAILISTFGCANGLTLAGARVYYAMSQDGLFFKAAGKLHPRWHTPVAALIVQAVWTCFLCISGSYSQLLEYIICTELIFYILTILCLFVLRVKRPDAERPYRAIGYPVLPAVYILMAAWICIVLLRYKPQYTWPGLVIVLLGIPVFAVWSRKGTSESLSRNANEAGNIPGGTAENG